LGAGFAAGFAAGLGAGFAASLGAGFAAGLGFAWLRSLPASSLALAVDFCSRNVCPESEATRGLVVFFAGFFAIFVPH
jgi:hypothetical protein